MKKTRHEESTLNTHRQSSHFTNNTKLLAYLLYLVGLQEVAGFLEVGLERFYLQLCLDGRFMFRVHLFFGGDLRAQEVSQKRVNLSTVKTGSD